MAGQGKQAKSGAGLMRRKWLWAALGALPVAGIAAMVALNSAEPEVPAPIKGIDMPKSTTVLASVPADISRVA